jgi:carbamoyl-phosphate synthase small subunit
MCALVPTDRATLALADGTVFRGRAFGARGDTVGEVVFCTAMTGYQEVLTDPSYAGQIVTMTAPEIGNVGTNDEDIESARPRVSGFVVRENSTVVSNWRAKRSLSSYLEAHKIPGIWDVDTRALVRHIRTVGAQMGALSTISDDADALIQRARQAPSMEGRDLVPQVTCSAPYAWDEPTLRFRGDAPPPPIDMHVVAYDLGIKRNILRHLRDIGARVTVVPANCSAQQALALSPDGIFLSNGPGDPAAVTYAIQSVKELLGSGKPIFGICLGHQILGLALGGRTYKLKFGHRGGNQPVKDLATGRVEITSQNHGFAVDVDSIARSGDKAARLTHINLNDQTVEGLALEGRPVFSVQYHPEASPGPHDANYLFQRFADTIRGRAG